MMHRVRLSQCLLVACFVWCAVGSAQAEEGQQVFSQQAQDNAERSFFSGLAHYRKGKIEQAILGFQRAYTAVPNRALLYNVARCHELAGRKKAAVAWYQAYLRTRPADTTAVTAKVKKLAPSKSANSAKVDVPAASLAKPLELQGIGYRWTKWSLVGVAGASLSAALGLTLNALDAAEKSRNATDVISTEQWSAQAEHQALLADVFVGVGLATAGVATYLFLSEALSEPPKVSVSPTRNGASVQYFLSF